MVSTPSPSDFTLPPAAGPDADPAPLGPADRAAAGPGGVDDADTFDRAVGTVAAAVAALPAAEPRAAVSLGAGVVDTLASLLEREGR